MLGKRRRRRQLDDLLGSDTPAGRLLSQLAGGATMIVDGDSTAELGWPDLDLHRRRAALVSSCEQLLKIMDTAETHLLFDAMVDGSVPRSKRITVALLSDRVAAAERALEVIDEVESTVVVWPDDPNRMSLRAAGAMATDPGDLLDAFLDS